METSVHPGKRQAVDSNCMYSNTRILPYGRGDSCLSAIFLDRCIEGHSFIYCIGANVEREFVRPCYKLYQVQQIFSTNIFTSLYNVCSVLEALLDLCPIFCHLHDPYF